MQFISITASHGIWILAYRKELNSICTEFSLTFLVNLNLKLQLNHSCFNPENGFIEVLLCLRLSHNNIICFSYQKDVCLVVYNSFSYLYNFLSVVEKIL